MANEKRLIDIKITEEELEDIIGGLDMIIDRCCESYEEEPYLRLIEKLKNAPTVDAVEVVHGYWIDSYSFDHIGRITGHGIDCSVCDSVFKADRRDVVQYWKEQFKVCPFCGAVMDGGNAEEA